MSGVQQSGVVKNHHRGIVRRDELAVQFRCGHYIQVVSEATVALYATFSALLSSPLASASVAGTLRVSYPYQVRLAIVSVSVKLSYHHWAPIARTSQADVPPWKFRNACESSRGSTTILFFSSSYRISVYPVNGKSFRNGCPSNP